MRSFGCRNGKDFREMILVAGCMSLLGAVGFLALLVRLFHISVYRLSGLTVAGWLLGLTGLFWAILLIREWMRANH